MLSESTLNQAISLACAEARKWLGATSPNPPVGAVALDSEGKVLAVAAHRKAGELHAEAELIRHCREHNMLSRVYMLCMTLEPCNHHGRTPPCTEAIIQSGIQRVVIGARDPNPHVKGGGIERLREAGIGVIEPSPPTGGRGCERSERVRGDIGFTTPTSTLTPTPLPPEEGEGLSGDVIEECKQLIHAFSHGVTTGKPWITVKRAFDRSGSMIPKPGQKVFTSEGSLRLAHRLRKKADAILTGSGTVLADNPLFTVRHVPDFKGKRRFLAILDRRSRVPENYLKAAHERGLIPLVYQNLDSAFEDLTRKGAQNILVEAGPALSQAALDAGLWVMKVDIHQGEPDRVEVGFNPKESIPFNVDKFRWEYMLPA